MKTWKQGVVGELRLSQATIIYIHCLKYPLARVYQEFEKENQALSKYMFSIMVDKSVLKNINRIGQKKLTKEESNEGKKFLYESKENKIYLCNATAEENKLDERVSGIEEIIDRYDGK